MLGFYHCLEFVTRFSFQGAVRYGIGASFGFFPVSIVTAFGRLGPDGDLLCLWDWGPFIH